MTQRKSSKVRTRMKKKAREIERRSNGDSGFIDKNRLRSMDIAFEASGEILGAVEDELRKIRDGWVSEKDKADLTILQAGLLGAFAEEFIYSVCQSAPKTMLADVKQRIKDLIPKMRERLYTTKRIVTKEVLAPPVTRESGLILPPGVKVD